MSPTPTSQTSDSEPGNLLYELEQRQDEVLHELDALELKLRKVLEGLGVSVEDECDEQLI